MAQKEELPARKNPDDSDKKAQANKAEFEQSAREAAKRAHAEKNQEDARLRLAAKEAKKEAKKQRRVSSVESAEDLAEAKERKEFFRKMHKIGNYEFDKKDKLPDLKNKRRVILEGSTDANWFDLEKKRDASWYQKIAEDAVRIKNLHGYVKTNLDPGSQARMDKLIDWVVEINNSLEKDRFKHEKWHTALTGNGFTQEEIFGEHGLYNYVLAFRRAASEYEGGKTVRRKLSEKDFKPNQEGNAKFDSVKLNLGKTKKGPKHRTTVIQGYEVGEKDNEKRGKQDLIEDIIIALWDKVEAAKMKIEFDTVNDNHIYIRTKSNTDVVNISILGNPKKPGSYIFIVNRKEIEDPKDVVKEATKLIDEFAVKDKADKRSAEKAEADKKIQEKIAKAKEFLATAELKSALAKEGFQIAVVERGYVEFADQGKKVRIDADFRIQRGSEDYLIKIDPETGKIKVKSVIVAILDSSERGKYKKSSEMGIFTVYEGDTLDASKFVGELKGLKNQVDERERRIIEVLRAQTNKLDKS